MGEWLRLVFGGRPPWMNALMVFCFYMAAVYVPYLNAPPDGRSLTLLVRTAAGARLVPDIRRAVAAIDRAQTIASVNVVKDVLVVGAQEVRVGAYFTVPIFALALLLALTGIYGLLAQTVSQRTHELAVRVALGARRRDLLRFVSAQGLALAAVGALCGAAGGWLLDRGLGSFLFGMPAEQGLALTGAGLFVVLLTVVAAFAPCRRALHFDPGKALKYE